jgi:zinc protease
LDRQTQPSLGADRPFVAPVVKTAKLENGLEVLVVERRDLPKVNIALTTRAGAVADPAAKAGVAHLTVTTMDLGTKTRKALEIEDALSDLGTSLSASAGREHAQLALDLLTRHASAALAIVADVVRNPVFPEEELAREKKRLLDSLAQQDNNPNALAGRIRPILSFGPTHPYGRPVQGLRATVEPITRQDLVEFHKGRWKPGSTALIFAGDVTLEHAVKLAREHFGAWTGGAAGPVSIPPPASLPAGRLYLVDRPDAAQTVIAQWLAAPSRNTPDYDALVLVDAVWAGGGFGNRLNLNLREDKGYSYGVFSTLALLGQGGYWYASGGVQTDKTSESVVEFDKEMKALAAARPISAEELAAAKTRRVRGYAQQFESLGRIASEVGELWVRGMPMTELQREFDATTAVTLEQVLAAVKKYVKPDSAGLLLVGDRAKIEPALGKLKLREIVILDSEGNPIAAAPATKSSR